jgi:hypothetical protein
MLCRTLVPDPLYALSPNMAACLILATILPTLPLCGNALLTLAIPLWPINGKTGAALHHFA